MAETVITPIVPTPPYLAEANATQLEVVTAIALDVTNGNIITLSKDILLRIENTDVGAQTVTITSFADPFGRLATITALSIAAGVIVNRRFSRVAWGDANGDLIVNGSDANILLEAYEL